MSDILLAAVVGSISTTIFYRSFVVNHCFDARDLLRWRFWATAAVLFAVWFALSYGNSLLADLEAR